MLKRGFLNIYMTFLSAFARVVDKRLKGGIRFTYARQKRCDGIAELKPYLIVENWYPVIDQAWVKKISQLASLFPFTAPVSIVNRHEFMILRALAEETLPNSNQSASALLLSSEVRARGRATIDLMG